MASPKRHLISAVEAKHGAETVTSCPPSIPPQRGEAERGHSELSTTIMDN